MKNISIVVPEGDVSLSNIEASFKIFSKINEAMEKQGRSKPFDVHLVGLTNQSTLSNGLFSVKPGKSIVDVDGTDLILIPAVHGEMKDVIAANQDFIPWILKQYKKGAEVASLCIGAFILASTGLLNGRKCTTHWLAAEEFKVMFPEVNLMPYKIITDENGVYTSGGAYSSLNLILYIVEKYVGRNMAIRSSKIFEIDIDRNSQSPFIIFQRQKDHFDELVKKAQDFIEGNFHDRITVDQLASMLSLGRRNFERRFKKATTNTVLEYIQRVKIEAAKMSFETSNDNVNEVMYNVGYSDTKSFRGTFKRLTGLSPVEYRNKYKKAKVI
ncbi:helix-turn-helix domain-containing protein [Olivibacter sp. SDN3]|uniref:GlxA family transcriptional regulator n=1 Tax=Olivibacter sp. SDN3 TaxID=2764720 RepID=UPI0016511FB6|nr:helix-turn-helix domain-containing protein [Olivibacter sp. SDN3]QNL48402.1 helix-turn-helix domain-containing protein [Olivibacter sp. SDN3]